jgi:hypothetical protein
MCNCKDADKDTLKLSLDASKHITSMAGLSGTTPSTIINALINVSAAPEQSQELINLQAFLTAKWQRQDAIEAQIIESDNQNISNSDIQTIDNTTSHTPLADGV